MYLDSHLHYIKYERGDYIFTNPVFFDDFMPDQLRPALLNCGVTGTIAVQSTPTTAETRFLLELAEQDKTLLGVVGWVNLEDPDVTATSGALLEHPKFLGIRPMLHIESDPRWILRSSVLSNLSRLIDQDLPIDLVVRVSQLPVVMELLGKLPNLKAAINHLGMPAYDDRCLVPWSEHMAQIARFPGVTCKLSGMITEIGEFQPTRATPFIQCALEAFGANRLMFGSDWPMGLKVGQGYDAVLRFFEAALPDGLVEKLKTLIRFENAARFYGVAEAFLGAAP